MLDTETLLLVPTAGVVNSKGKNEALSREMKESFVYF